ncbi:MAG TPA: hypothetical protein VM884_04630 [Flavisolibacter sp.]|nr:hypothetical protein [Flavisolibacter sp.]
MAKITVTSKSSAMKSYLPFLSLALAFASCSTAYKTGQTPDDVYFSPERQRDEYVRLEERDKRQYSNTSYLNDEAAREDRYLRMKTNYRRYSILDDYDSYTYSGSNYYRYNDYYRNNNYSCYTTNWNSKWGSYNPYYYNPYYSNPYYSGYIAGNVRPVYNKPRGSNLNIYNGNNNPNTYNTPSKGRPSNSASNNNNYNGSGTNGGGFLRDVFGGTSSSNKGSSSSNSNSSSSSTSTPSSGSSSSSSGTTSAPARKF